MRRLKHKPYLLFKAALGERKISYRELSRALGISVSSVCNKINGKSDFLLRETQIIEAVYKIPLSVFLPDGFRQRNFFVRRLK